MKLVDYRQLKYLSTWEECSRDYEADVSMVESDRKAINFDHVKTKFLNELGKSEECAASVDAVCEDSAGHYYMIEFKNGKIDRQTIRNKVNESLHIFNEITHTNISVTRQNMEFILVFNPGALKLKSQEYRAIEMARLGKSSCTLYGLDKFDGYCFQRAYMMTAEQFKQKMLDTISV